MIGGAGLSFILWRILPLLIAIPLIVVVLIFSAALAFYRVNDKPFVFFLQNAISYLFSSKLYLWKKKEVAPVKNPTLTANNNSQTTITVPRLSESKLHDLTWSLDIKNTEQNQMEEGR